MPVTHAGSTAGAGFSFDDCPINFGQDYVVKWSEERLQRQEVYVSAGAPQVRHLSQGAFVLSNRRKRSDGGRGPSNLADASLDGNNA